MSSYDDRRIEDTRTVRDGVPYGVAVWSSPEWRATAVAWLDERLAAAGLERRAEVEQPHVRPWATVLRVPADGGTAPQDTLAAVLDESYLTAG